MEQDDIINRMQGQQDDRSILLILKGALSPLDAANGSVAVKTYNQNISEGLGLAQVFHMPPVQDVKDAVGEDDFFAGTPQAGSESSHVSPWYEILEVHEITTGLLM
jgi:alpha-D-ribose 1-methylphosphonate 5-triphosphate synthase subunit PhnL